MVYYEVVIFYYYLRKTNYIASNQASSNQDVFQFYQRVIEYSIPLSRAFITVVTKMNDFSSIVWQNRQKTIIYHRNTYQSILFHCCLSKD